MKKKKIVWLGTASAVAIGLVVRGLSSLLNRRQEDSEDAYLPEDEEDYLLEDEEDFDDDEDFDDGYYDDEDYDEGPMVIHCHVDGDGSKDVSIYLNS